MTPIIKIWLSLTVISAVVQWRMARKKVSHVKGLILPMIFFVFGMYAWMDLSYPYIEKTIRLAFFIPAFFLYGVFEMVYWRTLIEEKGIKVQKMWKGWILPVLYWLFTIPLIYTRFLSVNEIRKVPDYYSAATVLFPGLLFLMIYYIVGYYRKIEK